MSEDQKKPQTPEEEGPSAQGLLEQMRDLESKVRKAEQEKELHLSGQIKQHDTLLAGIKNISPAVEEAEKNLAYFEEAKEKGLLRGEDLAKFEELKKSLEALKKTREETNKKVAAIYSQPEVEGRMRTLASQEDEAFDMAAEGNKLFNEELPKALLGILEDAGSYVQAFEEAKNEYNGAIQDVSQKIADLEKSVPKMSKPFSKQSGSSTTLTAYRSFRDNHRDFTRFKKELFDGAGQLGYFRRKEKEDIMQFASSKKMIELAQAEKVKEQKGEKQNQVQQEWQKKEQELREKFATGIARKIQEYEAKKRIFTQKTKQGIRDPQGGTDIFGAASEAYGQYSKQKGQMSREFRDQMRALLRNLGAHGTEIFRYHLFEKN